MIGGTKLYSKTSKPCYKCEIAS